MAGIGFALGNLYRSHTIADRATAYTHAAVVVAGPCIVAVLCIWLIGALMAERIEVVTISAFRALVIYCFAISFVVTAPIAYVGARLVSDKLHEREVTGIPAIMLGALAASALAITALVLPLFRLAFDLDGAVLLAIIVDCNLIGFVWIGALFCGVTRDYNSITTSFAAGMLVAVVAVPLLFPYWPSLAGMLWGFGIGVSVILFGLVGRILATFPFAVRRPAIAFANLSGALLHYWPIALGGLLGAIAAWIDKWIVWLSPAGRPIAFGLVHAPLYDSVIFLSYLIAVPAYAAFYLRLETRFITHYRRYYSDILEHATLRQIETNSRRLREETLSAISGILVPQIAICAVAALSAPLLIGILGMEFRQVGILRFGIVGALFQFLFMTCSSLALYFDRRMVFLLLQVAYLVLNATLTAASLSLGMNYLGLGFLVASVIAATLAYLALARTLYRLDYLTFVANNPAVQT